MCAPLLPKMGREALLKEFYCWFHLAWPTSLSRFCELLPWLITLMFIGRVGSQELAALSLTETWLYCFKVIVWGAVATAASTLISQAHGAKKIGAARGWLAISFIACLMCTGLVSLSWIFCKDALDALGFDPQLTSLAQSYTYYALPALWLESVPITVSTYLSSVQIMLLPTFMSLLTAVCDICVSFYLVFGWGAYRGIDNKLTAVALGWSISSCVGCIGHLILLRLYTGRELLYGNPTEEGGGGGEEGVALLEEEKGVASLNTEGNVETDEETEVDWKALRAWICSKRRWGVFFRQGLPALGSEAMVNIQFTIVGLLAATKGETVIATHNTLTCLFELIHTVATGMSEATAIRVGFHLGRGDIPAAKSECGVLWVRECSGFRTPLHIAYPPPFPPSLPSPTRVFSGVLDCPVLQLCVGLRLRSGRSLNARVYWIDFH